VELSYVIINKSNLMKKGKAVLAERSTPEDDGKDYREVKAEGISHF
jgi:hypothetical protein